MSWRGGEEYEKGMLKSANMTMKLMEILINKLRRFEKNDSKNKK